MSKVFDRYIGSQLLVQHLVLSPAAPALTASLVGVMMGLANLANPTVFTPIGTGRVLVIITGTVLNSLAGDGSSIGLRYGTGAAPANGAALVGTVPTGFSNVTSLNSSLAGAININMPFCVVAFISGLVVGTQYWFDLTLAAITGGNSTILNPVFNLIEV